MKTLTKRKLPQAGPVQVAVKIAEVRAGNRQTRLLFKGVKIVSPEIDPPVLNHLLSDKSRRANEWKWEGN